MLHVMSLTPSLADGHQIHALAYDVDVVVGVISVLLAS